MPTLPRAENWPKRVMAAAVLTWVSSIQSLLVFCVSSRLHHGWGPALKKFRNTNFNLSEISQKLTQLVALAAKSSESNSNSETRRPTVSRRARCRASSSSGRRSMGPFSNRESRVRPMPAFFATRYWDEPVTLRTRCTRILISSWFKSLIGFLRSSCAYNNRR